MGVLHVSLVFLIAMATASASVFNTTVGHVSGIEYPEIGIEKFLGIPYAEAAEGALRFKPPVRKARMEGVFNATSNDKVCPQHHVKYFAATLFSSHDPEATEDCLRLDIYRPLTAIPEKPLPVMIYSYGGGYIGGASRQRDGTNLALSADVIVVIPNYRLGLLGFFNTLDENSVGNFAFRDQCSAIEWVVDNIEAFGGNPSQVTIFGLSAGASSVLLVSMSSLCRGKFQRVIAHSATPYSHWSYNHHPLENALKVAERSGCPTEAGQLVNCLRSKSIEDIISYQHLNQGKGRNEFAPTYSGDVFPESPLEVVNKGDNSEMVKYFRSLDLLVGVTSGENEVVISSRISGSNTTGAILSDETFLALIHEDIMIYLEQEGDDIEKLAPAVKFQYTDWSNRDDDFANSRMYIRLSGDLVINMGDIKTARLHSGKTSISNRGSTYYFQFKRKPSFFPTYPWTIGASHGEDLFYVFDQIGLFNGSQEDADLAQEVMEYWGNFARTGNPNSPNRKFIKTTWPTYNPDTEEYILIDLNSTVDNFPSASRFAFWEYFFPSQLKLVDDCKKLETDDPSTRCTLSGSGRILSELYPGFLVIVLVFLKHLWT